MSLYLKKYGQASQILIFVKCLLRNYYGTATSSRIVTKEPFQHIVVSEAQPRKKVRTVVLYHNS